jgi:hypothetical protein
MKRVSVVKLRKLLGSALSAEITRRDKMMEAYKFSGNILHYNMWIQSEARLEVLKAAFAAVLGNDDMLEGFVD